MTTDTIAHLLNQLKSGLISKEDAQRAIAELMGNPAPTHPLVHQQVDDHTFRSEFNGTEPFFADHQIQLQRIFPAAAYFELVRAAFASLQKPIEPQVISIEETVWITPLRIGHDPVTVDTRFEPVDDTSYRFTVSSRTNNGPSIEHASGQVHDTNVTTPPLVAVDAIKQQCRQRQLTGDECYGYFEQLKIVYGASHRVLQQLLIGKDQRHYCQALGQLRHGEQNSYLLPPGALDGVLQTTLAYSDILNGATNSNVMPFCVERLRVFQAIPENAWVWVRHSNDNAPDHAIRKLDLDVIDQKGHVCVQIKGYSARRADQAATAPGTLIFQPSWVQQELSSAGNNVTPPSCVTVMLGELCQHGDAVQTLPHPVIHIGKQGTPAESYRYAAAELLDTLKRIIQEADQTTLVQLVSQVNDPVPYEGLLGMVKSASKEHPMLIGQHLLLESSMNESNVLQAITQGVEYSHIDSIRFTLSEGQQRTEVLQWNEIPSSSALPDWQDEGVYLITGGAGGVGLNLARAIHEQAPQAFIYLLGRSPVENVQPQLNAFDSTRVCYLSVDLANPTALSDALATVKQAHPKLHGVFHCAGTTRDALLHGKPRSDMEAVLSAKVNGTLNLIAATHGWRMGPMVLFGSGSGVFGNAGQTDYAAANGFMDALAQRMQDTIPPVVSIDWPLWQQGGMKATEALVEHMAASGLWPLQTDQALNALSTAMQGNAPQVLVISGKAERIRQRIDTYNGHQPVVRTETTPQQTATHPDLFSRVESWLLETLAKVTQLPKARINATDKFERYGIDSLMVMQFTRELEKRTGTLPKTLLFEYRTAQDLAHYFVAHHDATLTTAFELQSAANTAQEHHVAEKTPSVQRPASKPTPSNTTDIAIVGLSGRYAKADNMSELWRNLLDGVDCIEEIPASRWPHEHFYDANPATQGKTYAKWGGFIDGVDRFDPLFFHISPRDAERMDPQERLFLQCAYETLEDAGYTPEALRQQSTDQVGVFVGVMYEEYVLYGAQEQAQGNGITLAGSPASIANRVSYCFDFSGPSIALDSMCSSSLTALHLACQSIRHGECRAAIAGGVNLCIHPNKFLLLGQGKFAAQDGRCRSFGEGGTGYVPGEGVGAVLLKPLAQAEADGDHIYGLIKGSALNHGGATNAYTVPNPNAQANVIKHALAQAHVPDGVISYIEAHGTGTALGDPIEMAGLNAALAKHVAAPCALGSVKSNIGHCESAAGMAALSKTLLQMQHQTLVASLHSNQTNPHIDFNSSPFRVQQSQQAWHPQASDGTPLPRVAGISSFGAGGANAHVIVEEYPSTEIAYPTDLEHLPLIVVLSAQSKAQLQQQCARLLAHVEQTPMAQQDLISLVYTLQTGRDAFTHRLAFEVQNLEHLVQQLSSLVRSLEDNQEIHLGQVPEHKNPLALVNDDPDYIGSVMEKARQGDTEKLMTLWVNGLTVDWQALYQGACIRRMSLPTYPFAKERYWVPTPNTLGLGNTRNQTKLHPLLHQNTSDFFEQRYSSRFDVQDLNIYADHDGNTWRMKDSTLQEMARAAVADAFGLSEDQGVILDQVSWHEPLLVNDNTDIHIGMSLEEDHAVQFEIYTHTSDADETVYCSGRATTQQNGSTNPVALRFNETTHHQTSTQQKKHES